MNPYQVLDVSRKATAREIVQAAAAALQTKRHTAREVAEARKQLMDPEARQLADFIYFVDLAPLLQIPARTAVPMVKADELCPLEIFDRQT